MCIKKTRSFLILKMVQYKLQLLISVLDLRSMLFLQNRQKITFFYFQPLGGLEYVPRA